MVHDLVVQKGEVELDSTPAVHREVLKRHRQVCNVRITSRLGSAGPVNPMRAKYFPKSISTEVIFASGYGVSIYLKQVYSRVSLCVSVRL